MNSRTKVALAATFLLGSYAFARHQLKLFVAETQGENEGLRNAYRALINDMAQYLTDEEVATVMENASFRAILTTSGFNPYTKTEF